MATSSTVTVGRLTARRRVKLKPKAPTESQYAHIARVARSFKAIKGLPAPVASSLKRYSTVASVKTRASGGSFTKPKSKQELERAYHKTLQDRNRVAYELAKEKAAYAHNVATLQQQLQNAQSVASAQGGTVGEKTFSEQLGEVGEQAKVGFGGFGVGVAVALGLGALLLFGKGKPK